MPKAGDCNAVAKALRTVRARFVDKVCENCGTARRKYQLECGTCLKQMINVQTIKDV